ncbi:MAG TPA: hypothetical protein VLQ45_33210 [Thermoanaerobaculia bacterium]|nr:hypothetical protein [Thermoanaerobaculia bacterium]
MRSLLDGIIPSSRNAFSPSFLERIALRDEPPTAGEADVAGPWRIEEISSRGWGLFPVGASAARGDRPYAVFAERWAALLAAAFLPGTGREPAFRLHKDAGPEGYAIEANGGGAVIGHLALFDEKLVDALNAGESLLRSPESLANLLESGGQVALERSGAILDERITG